MKRFVIDNRCQTFAELPLQPVGHVIGVYHESSGFESLFKLLNAELHVGHVVHGGGVELRELCIALFQLADFGNERRGMLIGETDKRIDYDAVEFGDIFPDFYWHL